MKPLCTVMPFVVFMDTAVSIEKASYNVPDLTIIIIIMMIAFV